MAKTAIALAHDRPREAFDAIHGDMLRHFCELAVSLGGNPDDLLAQVGIELNRSRTSRVSASYRQFVALLECSALALRCPDFGMQLAVRQAATAFVGPLGDCMRNSRNLGDALQFVCSHSYAHSLAAWIWLRPSLSGASTVVGHDILLEGLAQKSQAMEYILLVGNLATLELTGGRIRARQVLFRHQPISPFKSYRQYFGCSVRFGRNADAVIYTEEDLACPILSPDADAFRAAATAIEARFIQRKPPFHADIRGVIAHLLGTQSCARERVAAVLNLHPRTLVRRLAAEGRTFQQIKDEVRRDRMLYYVVETDLEFAAVSEKLGFAEQAVMSRCCRKWFGSSPTQLRASAEQAPN